MVKFYGNNSEYVFDSKRRCLLCKFSKGELITKDKYIIERLKELGYKFEDEVKPTNGETKTKENAKTKG